MRHALALLILMAVAGCGEDRVHDTVPRQISFDRTYVFLLGGDDRPATAEALAERGFQVILPDTAGDADLRAVDIKEDIRQLLARGLPMKNVALVGLGAGGRLAMRTSGLAQVPDSRLVVVDACPRPGDPGREDYERLLRLHAPTIKGHFLSLVDRGGPCEEAFAAANGAEPWEVAVKGRAWLDEAERWLHGE